MRAALLALLVLAVPASAAFAPEESGAFVGVGTLEKRVDGRHYDPCAAAFAIASEPDGGWRISGLTPSGVPGTPPCGAWCCPSVLLYPPSGEARGTPTTGFEVEGTLLGITHVIKVGPLGDATAFHLTQTTTTSPSVWELVGELDFAPLD